MAYQHQRSPTTAWCSPPATPADAVARNAFEAELVKLRIIQKNSRPNHPTTCGKVERFQQTFKNWLRAQTQPATISQLHQLLDNSIDVYNHPRPHRSLAPRATPAVVYTTRPTAT